MCLDVWGCFFVEYEPNVNPSKLFLIQVVSPMVFTINGDIQIWICPFCVGIIREIVPNMEVRDDSLIASILK